MSSSTLSSVSTPSLCLHFTYLEINSLVCLDGEDGESPSIHYLDTAAKLGQTAENICGDKCAIPRDLSQYEPSVSAGGATTNGSQINVDRGPPMARSSIFCISYMNNPN
jgi:ATP citrate (pro-S)-lyase